MTKLVRARDGYICQMPGCGKRAGLNAAVHHIDYDKKNNAPENLVTLCLRCHGQTNWNREFWKFIFEGGDE